jgi:hypothetical protein
MRTIAYLILAFIVGFTAIVFLSPDPTEAQRIMDMRMSMGGNLGAVATYENYQVSDGVGGWDDYQVSDGVGGWDDYQVRQ